jgi:hypothetical protein
MIHFEPLISWTWAWLFAFVISVILCFQLFWILKTALSSSRKAIKIALNFLFGLLLIFFVFQPIWSSKRPEEGVLVHSSVLTKDEIGFWKDSLKIKRTSEISKFHGDGNPVYLLGSDFSEPELLKIGDKDIRWIVKNEHGSITFLNWKGILRKGEMQVVKGRIESGDSLKLSLAQQGELLTETIIEPNSGIFEFEFPAQVVGRNELDLMMKDNLIGRVNFFVQPSKPIQYKLQFAFPDAEIRLLTQYLINSGEQVNEQISISKNAVIRSGNSEPDSLQFLIIDPAQLSKKSTQEAIANGASVLVMNLNDVGNDISSINKAFESNFKVKRTTNEESREIEADLEASPYEFESVIAQKLLFEKAFAVQQIGNVKVGVSLLGRTFPIKLAGDSLRYQAIWQQILGAMVPQESGAVEVSQPVFTGLQAVIQVNQEHFEKDFISIESDSVFLQPSLVNPFSKAGSFVSLDSGWVSLADSLEFYSYSGNEWPSLKAAKLRADFLTMHLKKETSSAVYNSKRKVSDWLWYGMFLIVLTLIWLEPKVLK